MEVRDMALVRGRKALLDSGERGDDQEDEIRGNDFVKSLEEVCVLPPSMRKLATWSRSTGLSSEHQTGY